MAKSLPIIQVLPRVSGSAEFEAARASILEEFSAKVPEELHIPQAIVNNPPKDVSGVPRECGILSPQELDITENYDAVALAEAIATKRLTAVAVATAFAKRAIVAHQLTCCLSEWFMDDAVEQAKKLDEHLEKTGKTVGPLHGVPIAVKEMIPLAGHTTSWGFLVTRHKSETDSHMMAILRKAGAVFYCKTLQPQGIMHLETVDTIFGRTLNPYNINLSGGGSTGGGATLVAMRGGVLAVGSDIGGSIRAPASFCGLYGFKATSYFLPMQGFTGDGGFAAELNVLGATGPIGVSLRDMDFFVSVLKNAQPHLEDPRLVPIPWTGLKGQPKTPLKVGFMMNDGLITPQPPVTRALKWAREQLSTATGFEVKDFTPFRVAEALQNIQLAFFPDGGKMFKGALEATGEPMLPLTQLAISGAEAAGQDLDAAGVLEQRVARDKFRSEFSVHWTEQDVDVVICPSYVGPACTHETSFFWNYPSFWNYVDCPGAVVPTPIKALKKGEEKYAEADATPLSDDCKRVRQFWEEGDFEGAPVNLQILARKYHDNELFAALKAFQGPLGI